MSTNPLDQVFLYTKQFTDILQILVLNSKQPQITPLHLFPAAARLLIASCEPQGLSFSLAFPPSFLKAASSNPTTFPIRLSLLSDSALHVQQFFLPTSPPVLSQASYSHSLP